MGDCWTCCRDMPSSELGSEGSNSIEPPYMIDDSLVAMSVKEATTMDICLAVCWPSEHECTGDWVTVANP